MAHAGNCSLDVLRVTFSTQSDALSNRTIGDNENANASSSPSINWSLRATESFLRDSEVAGHQIEGTETRFTAPPLRP